MTLDNYASTMLLSHAAAVSSTQLKHINHLDPGIINMVIECKITMVIKFNADTEFIMVNEFIVFTECILFMCDVVIDGERWSPAGHGVNPSPHTTPMSRCKLSFKFCHPNFKCGILIWYFVILISCMSF